MLRHLAFAFSLSCLIAAGSASAQEQKPKSEPKPLPVLEACKLGEVDRIHRLDKVFLAGQPTAEDFKLAKTQEGLKFVINLRTTEELEYDEAATLKGLGVEYLHLPVQSPAALNDATFDKARKVLADKKNHPVMLHCASANRVGAVWLAYRVLDDKVPLEKALDEAKKVGLRSPDLEAKAKDYIARKTAKP